MTKTIEMSDELYEKLKEEITIGGGKEINNYEDLVGGKYYFRTVTYAAVGEVKKIVGRFVHLKNASWVADTGRFADFIKGGVQSSSEIEPVGEQFLNLDTVVDFFPWKNDLPKKQQ
jgi:hypothetical protein